jgi:hypothetical protein
MIEEVSYTIIFVEKTGWIGISGFIFIMWAITVWLLSKRTTEFHKLKKSIGIK